MKRTALLAALLCSLSWVFISGSDSETVEVEEGKNVTLVCSNISTQQTTTEWFRVVNRTKPSCIASMYFPEKEAKKCPGFKSSKFEMTSNTSAVFLRIAQADLSDSGLYYCGFYTTGNTFISTASLLNVVQFQVVEIHDHSNQSQDIDMAAISIILGGVCVLLAIITIALVFKVKKLKTAMSNVVHQETHKDFDAKDLDSGNLKFFPKTVRNKMTMSAAEVETHVVYFAVKKG